MGRTEKLGVVYMKIAVMGGDGRTPYLCSGLERRGAEVSRFALGRGSCASARECALGAQAVVLPVPVSRGPGLLNAPLSDFPVPLAEVLAAVPEGAGLFGGMPPAGLGITDVGAREDYIVENAAITADAAAAMLMRELGGTVCGKRVAVAGFGRIGLVLALRLRALGADVLVLARRSEVRAMARALGLRAGTEPESGADAVLNTVPARVFTEESLGRAGLYIELASAPGGCSREAALSAGARYLSGAGLPGKAAPEAAGEALCRCLWDMFEERGYV
ncbi:MAG TPA: dipicolinate synthase [Firmicutes bacterium]|nr:dipicolinate synthase [Bacillota bacterium]